MQSVHPPTVLVDVISSATDISSLRRSPPSKCQSLTSTELRTPAEGSSNLWQLHGSHLYRTLQGTVAIQDISMALCKTAVSPVLAMEILQFCTKLLTQTQTSWNLVHPEHLFQFANHFGIFNSLCSPNISDNCPTFFFFKIWVWEAFWMRYTLA